MRHDICTVEALERIAAWAALAYARIGLAHVESRVQDEELEGWRADAVSGFGESCEVAVKVRT